MKSLSKRIKVLATVFGSSILLASTTNNQVKSVKIGNQIWMTKNLDVESFENGDFIREISNKTDWEQVGKDRIPAFCYYEFNSKNNLKYGKLYNWYAVNSHRKLAPKGWHIPNDTEWELLISYLGGKSRASIKLRSQKGWNKGINGNNQSGFSALPAGCIGASNLFYNIGNNGFWWSTSNNSIGYHYLNASYLMLDKTDNIANLNETEPSQGFSVRCLKD